MISRARKVLIQVANRPRSLIRRWGLSRTKKVFVIGRNKTGTTSLQIALRDLGYFVAPTNLGELLLKNWIDKDFASIIEFCRNYDAFQDIPFSLAHSYRELDQAFPGSRFILTVRDNENQWFDSLCRFHSKRFGKNGRLPEWSDLRQSQYRYPGFVADCQQYIYDAENQGLYNADVYKQHYLQHNDDVRNYFAGRESDFIEINVKLANEYTRLCKFLKRDPASDSFPWENKT